MTNFWHLKMPPASPHGHHSLHKSWYIKINPPQQQPIWFLCVFIIHKVPQRKINVSAVLLIQLCCFFSGFKFALPVSNRYLSHQHVNLFSDLFWRFLWCLVAYFGYSPRYFQWYYYTEFLTQSSWRPGT